MLLYLTCLLVTAQPQRLAFSMPAGEKKATSIFTCNLEGKDIRQVTKSPTHDEQLLWSPKGDWIVFERFEDSAGKSGAMPPKKIWKVSPRGSGLKKLTTGPDYDGLVGWVEGGSRVRLIRIQGKQGFYDVGLDGSNFRKSSDTVWDSPNGRWQATLKTEEKGDKKTTSVWIKSKGDAKSWLKARLDGSAHEPVWTADQKRLLLYTEEKEGTALRVYPFPTGPGKLVRPPSQAYIECPTFSPDGRQIAFLKRSLVPEGDGAVRQLYVMNVDGTGERQITDRKGDKQGPEWTRDGRSIVISCRRDISGPNGAPSYLSMIIDVKSGKEKVLPIPETASRVRLSP